MSEKRATDHLEPAAKKRGSDRQLTKDDNPSDDEEVEAGSFARASEDVIKQRKIVRARRGADAGGGSGANPFAGIQLTGTSAAAPAAANPFAGVALFPVKPAEQPAAVAGGKAKAEAGEAKPAEVGAEKEEEGSAEKEEEEKEAQAAAVPALAKAGGFGALASGGAAFGCSGFASTGGGFGSLASSTGGAFSFGSGAASSSGASIFSFSATASAPAFSFGAGAAPAAAAPAAADGAAPAAADGAAPAPAAGSLFGTTPATGTSLFGAASASAAPAVLPAEQAVTTGEEDEATVWSGEGALFEYDAAKQARVVMRAKGNLRLLLNARLWAEMQVTRMEGGKGATFAVVNHAAAPEEAAAPAAAKEGGAGAAGEAAAPAAPEPKLATYALRIKSPEVLDQFLSAMNAHKAGTKGGAAA
eukprot:scaffold1.g5772.t1